MSAASVSLKAYKPASPWCGTYLPPSFVCVSRAYWGRFVGRASELVGTCPPNVDALSHALALCWSCVFVCAGTKQPQIRSTPPSCGTWLHSNRWHSTFTCGTSHSEARVRTPVLAGLVSRRRTCVVSHMTLPRCCFRCDWCPCCCVCVCVCVCVVLFFTRCRLAWGRPRDRVAWFLPSHLDQRPARTRAGAPETLLVARL